MGSPAVFGYSEPLATSDYIAGPLVASVAIMAIWEVVRELRWLNVAVGTWIVIAPWVLRGPTAAAVNGLLTGTFIAVLALTRGSVRSRYGGGWAAVFRR